MLSADDLTALIAAVFAVNQRGEVLGVSFHDKDGQALQLAYCEAHMEVPGLRMRTVPEPTPDELAARVSQQPVLDPRTVTAPASMAELDATLRDDGRRS